MSRETILEQLAENHQKTLDKTLEQLELQVVKATNSIADTTVKTRILVEIRPKLKTAIESSFLNWADKSIRGYDSIAKEIMDYWGTLPLPANFKTLTQVDASVIADLKKLSFQGFEDIANEYLDELANTVYQSTLIGRSKDELILELRQKINGVYIKSNEKDVAKLVAFIKANRNNKKLQSEVDLAIEQLNIKYGSDVTGQNLRRYAGQMVHDSLRQFDASFIAHKAEEAGIESFRYDGSNLLDTRDWCRSLKGRILTKQEVYDKWNGNTWKGKSSGDPFIVRGGYNCRHFWTPFDPTWKKG